MRRAPDFTRSPVRSIAADSDHRLWVRYEDGGWTWADLAGFIDSVPEPDLRPQSFFLTARLDRQRGVIDWSDGRSLPLRTLRGSERSFTPEGVYIVACHSSSEAWYRPLVLQGMVAIRSREALPENPPEALALLLKVSTDRARTVAGLYGVEEVHLYSRLMDLLLLMTRSGTPEESLSRSVAWRLHQPWTLGPSVGLLAGSTPALAVTYGWLALVEQLFGSSQAARLR